MTTPIEIYLHNGEEQFGPYSEEEVTQYIATGNVTSKFLFFAAEKTADWTPILGSYLMPAPEQSMPVQPQTDAAQHEDGIVGSVDNSSEKADHLNDAISRVKSRLESTALHASQGTGPAGNRIRIDGTKNVMIRFSQGGKEYGPYDITEAIYYPDVPTAFSIRLADSPNYLSFQELEFVLANAHASEKQCKAIAKLKIEFDPELITFEDAKWAIDEITNAKPPTASMRKKLNKFGIDDSAVATRGEANRLISVKTEEEEILKAAQQREKTLAKFEKRGIVLNHPISEEEFEELVENGPPTKTQIKSLNNYLQKLQKFKLEFKIHGEAPPRNFSKESIQDAIDLIDEAICDSRFFDDDLYRVGVIQAGTGFYDMSRKPNREEQFQIQRTIIHHIMNGGNHDTYHDDGLMNLIQHVCKGIKFKKS
jgi:hypothetical protein